MKLFLYDADSTYLGSNLKDHGSKLKRMQTNKLDILKISRKKIIWIRKLRSIDVNELRRSIPILLLIKESS
jgi:hypothetical protein